MERISKIENNVQDKTTIAWQMLCDYVDKVATENHEEFAPSQALGKELFSQIYTLPISIAKLKKVKRVWLYGSSLKRIPPEIGEMESLEHFDPYTSYNLFWFPYEITNCKNLKDSRVSTRVLYGNIKNRKGFPRLNHNPVRYDGDTLHCSVCKKEITYQQTTQLWISLLVATDVLPLLVNVCSETCKSSLPVTTRNYLKFPHQGGAGLQQPTDYEDYDTTIEFPNAELQSQQHNSTSQTDKDTSPDKNPPLLKLIRKIWE